MQFLQTLFSPDAWELLGRFHVVIIHFPVALLIAVAIVEAFSLVRGKSTAPAPAAQACLLLGLLSAIAAATTGWAHGGYEDPSDTLFYHRWLGISATVLSLIVLILHHLAKSGSITKLRIYQLAAFITAAVVGITGHLGGTLTHGADNFTITHVSKPPTSMPTTAAANTFAQVQPILAAACYECHGAAKQKGNLRVDSLAALLKGGKNGPAILPGDSEHSLLIRRCLGLDGKPSMPDNRPMLPADQIQLLKNWIDSLPPAK